MKHTYYLDISTDTAVVVLGVCFTLCWFARYAYLAAKHKRTDTGADAGPKRGA